MPWPKQLKITIGENETNFDASQCWETQEERNNLADGQRTNFHHGIAKRMFYVIESPLGLAKAKNVDFSDVGESPTRRKIHLQRGKDVDHFDVIGHIAAKYAADSEARSNIGIGEKIQR